MKETVELKAIIDTWRVIEENGITEFQQEGNKVTISAEDWEKISDGIKNERYKDALLYNKGGWLSTHGYIH